MILAYDLHLKKFDRLPLTCQTNFLSRIMRMLSLLINAQNGRREDFVSFIARAVILHLIKNSYDSI